MLRSEMRISKVLLVIKSKASGTDAATDTSKPEHRGEGLANRCFVVNEE